MSWHKLTPDQIVIVYISPLSSIDIADRFGVSYSTVYMIRSDQRHTDITCDLEQPERTVNMPTGSSQAFVSKLTDEQAAAAFQDPRPQRVIAEELGVSRSVIANLKTGRSYRWVTGMEQPA